MKEVNVPAFYFEQKWLTVKEERELLKKLLINNDIL